ncbi:MAG: hypothetical protein AAFV98_15015 [Chloroflexota bacterium]
MQLNSSFIPSKKLAFTDAELVSNRSGRLSDVQRKSIQRRYRMQSAFSMFFLGIIVAFGLWFLLTRQNYIVGVPLLLVALYLGYAFVNLARISVKGLRVQAVTGALEKEAIVSDDHTFYYFRVNDVLLRVSRNVFDDFEDSDATYTFYYVQRKNDAVSDVATPLSYEVKANKA